VYNGICGNCCVSDIGRFFYFENFAFRSSFDMDSQSTRPFCFRLLNWANNEIAKAAYGYVQWCTFGTQEFGHFYGTNYVMFRMNLRVTDAPSEFDRLARHVESRYRFYGGPAGPSNTFSMKTYTRCTLKLPLCWTTHLLICRYYFMQTHSRRQNFGESLVDGDEICNTRG